MNLTHQTLTDEGVHGQLGGPTPLAEATYRLYMCKRNLARPLPRIVVLHSELEWEAAMAGRRGTEIELEADEACELLWRTLSAHGERIGEVAAASPQAGDCVLLQHGDAYRVSLPVHEQDELDSSDRAARGSRPLPSQDRGLRPEFRLLPS